MTEIRIPVPRVPAGLIGNLVGLLGLIAVAVAVGGLTGNWWWSILAGGAFAVALSVVADTHDRAAGTAAVVPAQPEVRTRPVAVARSA